MSRMASTRAVRIDGRRCWRDDGRGGPLGSVIGILLLLPFALTLIVAGCGWVPTKQPDLGPAEITTRFYRWCVGYPGNPTVDREYRNSPYLAESFISEIDETVASMAAGGADPLLLAQDVPERFIVDEAQITGDVATVRVDFYWSGNDTPAGREVALRLIDGAWKITGVSVAP